MPAAKGHIRSVQDIKTHAGLASTNKDPHELYLRISCLEMEMYRRNKERESALRRVQTIEARFAEIEAEKQHLLDLLKNLEQDRQACRKQTDPGSRTEHRQGRGFPIRY